VRAVREILTIEYRDIEILLIQLRELSLELTRASFRRLRQAGDYNLEEVWGVLNQCYMTYNFRQVVRRASCTVVEC
jgi:hypothetical protein